MNEQKKAERRREKAELRYRLAQEQELAKLGVVERQRLAVLAIGTERVQQLLEDARVAAEATEPIRDYLVLRALYVRVLEAAGVDLTDLLLRFSWDPVDQALVVDVAPTPEVAARAREALVAARPGLLLPMDLATMEQHPRRSPR
jgi:hypothetical protein